MEKPRNRIAILPPIPVPEFERERRRARYAAFADPSTDVDVRALRGGPALTDGEYELYWATGFMILEAEKAVSEGASGVLLDCTVDPGFAQIAQSVDVPVVGALAAAAHAAMQLGGKFSVLALDAAWARMIRARLRDYGLEGHVASIEIVGAHVYKPAADRPMRGGEAAAFYALLEAAGVAALKAGADSVILGSTTVIDGREELERALGVPVIAPGIAALKTIEAMLAMGLRPSRRAFPKPAIAYGEAMAARLFPKG